MKAKIYVGLLKGAAKREVFKYAGEPTEATHGEKYGAVIGAFRTMRGANFMAEHGANNPHVQTVEDAERIAALPCHGH